MRKSVSPLPGNEGRSSAGGARVFGVPLEEVTHTHTLSGHEVPVLVKHIVDYIEEHGGLDLEGLFLVNGNAERVDWLRQRYDSGEEVELQKEADLASAVSLLRLFLQELPEPVVPTAIQGHILQLLQEDGGEEEVRRNLRYVLQQLPQQSYGLLRFLCRFLAGVAALQPDSWTVGALAAVFGPDIFHLSLEGEDLREEAVSRVLAELLDNQEELFDSEEDDVSTTNDYSSINEQITELDDEKGETECEELPQDREEGPASSQSPQHTPGAGSPADSSHLSPISILPAGSADILERTIRAAVEQHLLDLKTSIDQDLSNYDNQETAPDDPPTQSSHDEDNEEQTDPEDSPCYPDGETPVIETEQHAEHSQQDTQTVEGSSAALEDSSGMDMDTEALIDAENNINTARKDGQPCDNMGQSDIMSCDPESRLCDQNANTSEANRNHLPQCQPNTGYSPHLQLFPDNQWEDPVPAYRSSWQDDSESGEAQLSPLAGRMVNLPPLPLEEEDEEHLLARRFLDFGAHGAAHRFLHQDPDAISPTKTQRPRRASFGSKEAMRGGDSVSHQLTKKLQHLKKKIKQFEDQFEKERNYKPSHGDKAANPKVLKWMTDLTKLRRQIKDAKHRAESELGPLTRPRSNTLPKSFGSTLDHAAHDAPGDGRGGQRPTKEETLELIQRRVRGKRQEDGWPDDVKTMTKEQLSCEKMVLQKNLLHYEGLHGRPVTREDRLVVKPLYDRYRLVKQMLTRVSITTVISSPTSKRRGQILQPIIEGETSHFCEEIQEEEEEEVKAGGQGVEEEGGGGGEEVPRDGSEVIMALTPVSPLTEAGGPVSSQNPQTEGQSHHPVGDKTTEGPAGGQTKAKLEEGSGKLALDLRMSSFHASSMPELLEQLWKARAEKKKLRKTIKEFEEDFYQHNGRNVQKEDRVPMMEEYREYKRIKAKLRLLEVLISKQDSSKSI